MNLEERVAKLERSNRRWKIMTGVALVVAVAAGARQATDEPSDLVAKNILCESLNIEVPNPATEDVQSVKPFSVLRKGGEGAKFDYGLSFTFRPNSSQLSLHSADRTSGVALVSTSSSEDGVTGEAALFLETMHLVDDSTVNAILQIQDEDVRRQLLEQTIRSQSRSEVALSAMDGVAEGHFVGHFSDDIASTNVRLHSDTDVGKIDIMENEDSLLVLGRVSTTNTITGVPRVDPPTLTLFDNDGNVDWQAPRN